jgi:hypothetical protein
LEIGKLNNFSDGLIDDIKIYNYALSESEITALYTEEDPKQLIGSWSFNDGNAKDESGNANHGIVNGASLTEDRFGNADAAYSFDGLDDKIQIPNSESINITNQDFTLSLWFSADSVKYWQTLFASAHSVHAFNMYYHWDKIYFSSYINGDTQTHHALGSGNLGLKDWHHLVVNRNAKTGLSELYINNIKVDSFLVEGTLGSKDPSSFWIGGYWANYFQGKLDDYRLYNYVLSEEEISELYKEPNPYMVGQWDFNGNAKDISGHENHGSVNGAILTEDRFGNANSAYVFDGVDDYISVLNADELNFAEGDYTISTWINWEGDTNNNNYIVSKGSAGAVGYSMRVDGGGYFRAGLQGVEGDILRFGCEKVDKNNWRHLIVEADRDSLINLYLDGNLVCSGEYVSGNETSISNKLNLVFGAFSKDLHFFKGEIDDIKLFNKTLSEQERKSLYTKSDSTYSLYSGSELNLFSNEIAAEYNYQWQYRQNDTLAWNNISAQTNSQFSITKTSMSDAGYYRCLVKEPETNKFFYETVYEVNVLLEEGLLGSWTFDGNANDNSGYENHGTVNGATLTEDRFGNANSAYVFDGVDDHIKVNNYSFKNTDEWSISLWLDWKEGLNNQELTFLLGQEDSGVYNLVLRISDNNRFAYRDEKGVYTIGKKRWSGKHL